ncbi:hypothetical protein B9479_002560 [Cryptococcus floricola]|uniref:Uncharacterized protein n=1 Tax=Cryptococcus floricola TaxID=2591691 RepID=A0A5D3B3M0_9TREE|nr:hypothetical protein B9479_002560 [Cryptococcus floricola]
MLKERHPPTIDQFIIGFKVKDSKTDWPFFQPEYPYNARILKPLEREVAVWRLEKEAGVAEGNETTGSYIPCLGSDALSIGLLVAQVFVCQACFICMVSADV